MATTDPSTQDPAPPYGLITWEVEGNEGGPYHSRKLHVPSATSGLTLGRGYDMKNRSAAKINQDLSAAGVPAADAARISQAAGLAGDTARKFITDQQLTTFEISKTAQVALFLITYADEKAVVDRISAKPETVAAYGACNWAKIDQAVIDLLVDLKYRGDYTPDSRVLVQPLASRNDLAGLAQVMKQRGNWPNVPKDRFERRVAFLDKALAARPAA
jgi:hypothetical protein